MKKSSLLLLLFLSCVVMTGAQDSATHTTLVGIIDAPGCKIATFAITNAASREPDLVTLKEGERINSLELVKVNFQERTVKVNLDQTIINFGFLDNTNSNANF